MGSFLTIGGLGTLIYSLYKGSSKNIGKNIQKLDRVLYDGNIDKFIKNPLKTIGATVVKKFAKKVASSVKTFVTKTVPSAIKTVGKKIVSTAKKIGGSIKTTFNNGLKSIRNLFSSNKKGKK